MEPRTGLHHFLALLIFLFVLTKAQAAAPRSIQDEAACGIESTQLLNSTCNLECRRDIHNALVNIYNVMNGANWNWSTWEENTGSKGSSKWSNGTCEPCASTKDNSLLPSYCCWEGVTCCEEHSAYMHEVELYDCEPYTVTVLQARGGDLHGPFQEIMQDLLVLHKRGMTHLDMSRNFITGTLPPAIGDLVNLQVLMLGSNNMSGTVPPELSQLRRLRQLDLEFNFLEGALDAGQLCKDRNNSLQALYLRANNFTGPLNLSNCVLLEVADIQENGFDGPLPVSRNNRQLSVLRARLNDFSGPIDEGIWELPQLMTFDVTNNSLSGTLPQNLAPSVFLTNLHLGSNNLQGSVPVGLTQSSQLSKLDLSDNPGIIGTLPDMRWMLGLQQLILGNTLISGEIPEQIAVLPYLEVVDIHNTRMTCCHSLEAAEQRHREGTLLPDFLVFNSDVQRLPTNEILGHDESINRYLNTGQNMMCDTVHRSPEHTFVKQSVSRPADLSKQAWHMDPEYFWFLQCQCMPGFQNKRNSRVSAPIWCNTRTHNNETTAQCIDMSVLMCVAESPPLRRQDIAGIAIGAVALILLLVMLTSVSLNMCIARTGKIRRQLNWWHKHLAGMPKSGKMAIVVTDIEGYSDLFKRCPEQMYRALTLHNNVIRKAKYANCGSTVQQEGDSYTLVFHDAFDAVSFCLQAQLALMEVAWPEGLMDSQDSSAHGASRSGRNGRRLKLSQWDSLLTGGTSGWLRKSKPSLKHGSSLAHRFQSNDSMHSTSNTAGAHSASNHSGRAAYSRSRMLDIFRSQPALEGSAGGIFNGLRVRMGIVTGTVEGPAESSAALANIMNSPLYKLAVDVSDAGNGGQILMDDATFARIKEELHPLGAVDANGLNYDKLAARTSLWHLLCLGALCSSRRKEVLDADEAVVLDMGQYELPAMPAKLNSLTKTTSQKVHATFKYLWPAHSSPTSGGTAATGAALTQQLTPPAHEDGQGPGVKPVRDLQLHQLEATSSLPGAIPLDYFGALVQSKASGGGSACGVQRQRVRLLQILPPSLVGRAQVWGNSLSVKSNWVCTDAPYFEAPGARDAPLGNLTAGRTISMQTSHTGAAPTVSSPLQQQRIQQGQQLQQQQDMVAAAAAAAARNVGALNGISPAGSGSLDSPRVMLSSRHSNSGNANNTCAAVTDEQQMQLQQPHDIEAQTGILQQQQQQQLVAQAAVPMSPSVGALSSLAPVVTAPPGNGNGGAFLGGGLCSPLVGLVPPVTMVFLVVEGAKVFGNRRKHLLKEIHAHLSQLLMEALRHVHGGYLCRMQEGDLKYMVAFASPRAALEWCVMVQEAAMYLNWDDSKFQRIPLLSTKYDADGQLVFRGPRLKMGVCEGIPRTIIPDHLGRADYHGSSVNQAARYMDAGAHGGQIACEAELAAAVLAEWKYGIPDSTSTADETCSDASCDQQVMRTASAPAGANLEAVAAAAVTGCELGADGLAIAEHDVQLLSDAESFVAAEGTCPVLRANTSRSLDSSMAALGSKEQQQLQQQFELSRSGHTAQIDAAAAVCSAAAAAAAAVRDSGSFGAGTPFVAVQACSTTAAAVAEVACAPAGGPMDSLENRFGHMAAGGVSAPSAAVPIPGRKASAVQRDSSVSSSLFGSVNAGGSLGSRFSRLFQKNSSMCSRLGADSNKANQQQQQHVVLSVDDISTPSQQQQQQDMSSSPFSPTCRPGGTLSPVSTGRGAAVLYSTTAAAAAAQRMFGLSEVPRTAVEVQAHHLGSFKFKGNPQPVQMVNIMLSSIAGRSLYFPADPPKGKGNRVAASSGIAGTALAPLPTLALQHRARVPAHILERVATPASVSLKQQLRGQLGSSSMPVRRSRTMAGGVTWADEGDGGGMLPPGGRRTSSHTLSFLSAHRGRTPSIPEGGEGAEQAAAAGITNPMLDAAAAAGPPMGSNDLQHSKGAVAALWDSSGASSKPRSLGRAQRSHSAVSSRSSGHGQSCTAAGEVLISLAALREQFAPGSPNTRVSSGAGSGLKGLVAERLDIEGQQEVNGVV